MRRHPPRLFLAAVAAILLASAGCLGAVFTAALYDSLMRVQPDCGGHYAGQTPASFQMPTFEEVRFPSRDPAITIDAWWIPGTNADSPAVVLAHGSSDCKRAPSVLTPAGMLHKAGYSVLVVDLRNHGSSTVTNGRIAGGAGEARDILGAWDWLRSGKNLPAGRIGLFGLSLGAGAAIIASGEESQVAAVWEDSGYADLTAAFRYQVGQYHLPGFMADLAMEAGRLRGEDFATRPVDSLSRLAGRPMAIVLGERDDSVPVDQGRELAATARRYSGRVVDWILPGVGHTGAMWAEPAEYERRLLAFFAGSIGAGSLGGTAAAPDA